MVIMRIQILHMHGHWKYQIEILAFDQDLRLNFPSIWILLFQLFLLWKKDENFNEVLFSRVQHQKMGQVMYHKNQQAYLDDCLFFSHLCQNKVD